MSVILRDRVNDLLSANAELEHEVARLREQQADRQHARASEEEEMLNDLQETRKSLNAVSHENEQLRMAIGRARYSAPPPPSLSEREKMNLLQTENEELKKEVRKFRYSPAGAGIGQEASSSSSSLSSAEAEAVPEVEVEEEELKASVETPKKLRAPTMPGILSLAAKGLQAYPDILSHSLLEPLRAKAWQTEQEEEEELDLFGGKDSADYAFSCANNTMKLTLELDQPEPPTPAELTLSEKSFAAFRAAFQQSADIIFQGSQFEPTRGLALLDQVEALLERHSDEMSESETKAQFRGLEAAFLNRFGELHDFVETEVAQLYPGPTGHALSRLGKAFMATLDSVIYKVNRDYQIATGQFAALTKEFDDKWRKILDKYDKIVKEHEAKSFLERMKNATGAEEEEKEKGEKQDRSWMFSRASQRHATRKEEARADWVFDRAHDRQALQEFNAAGWDEKRAHTKRCDALSGDCEDLASVVAAANNGKARRRGRGEEGAYFSLGDLRMRQDNLRKEYKVLEEENDRKRDEKRKKKRKDRKGDDDEEEEKMSKKKDKKKRYQSDDDDDDDDSDDDNESKKKFKHGKTWQKMKEEERRQQQQRKRGDNKRRPNGVHK